MKESARYTKLLSGQTPINALSEAVPTYFMVGVMAMMRAVFAELCDLVEEVIAVYKQEGKPLPPPHSWQTVATRG